MIFYLGDALATLGALALATLVRFAPASPPAEEAAVLLRALPILLLARMAAAYLFELSHWSFRYAGISDLRRLFAALGLGTFLAWAGIFLSGIQGTSRAVLLLEPVFSLFLMGWYRFSLRLLPDRPRRAGSRAGPVGRRKVLLYGAGEAGQMTAGLLAHHPDVGLEVVGYLDDDPAKEGAWIENVRVLGGRARLADAAHSLGVEEILIAIPSASGKTIREIVEACREIRLRFRIVPGILSIIQGVVPFDAIREMRPEDLLGRQTFGVSPEAHRGFLGGRRVLVTGGAGSIGSEIVRQAAAAGAEVTALDISETGVYHLSCELGSRARVLLGDIRDAAGLARRLAEIRPEIVFHAAAYKHVPILEVDPEEAVRTNLLGTETVLAASARAGARCFVFISTDKAVSPAGVMGATKRAAERLVAARAPGLGLAAAIVRFGNVFDSSGSVVPLFRRQIARGGPVTVTHPHIVRFFMTIPEAVHLVLHAGGLAGPASGASLFIFDMGDPVRILDLARAMILLSGKLPDSEIPIEFTGLRPGEKLYEEFHDAHIDRLEETSVPRIRRVLPVPVWTGEIESDLARFSDAAGRGDREEIRRLLARVGDLRAPQ